VGKALCESLAGLFWLKDFDAIVVKWWLDLEYRIVRVEAAGGWWDGFLHMVYVVSLHGLFCVSLGESD
jgi:hypothetical protein